MVEMAWSANPGSSDGLAGRMAADDRKALSTDLRDPPSNAHIQTARPPLHCVAFFVASVNIRGTCIEPSLKNAMARTCPGGKLHPPFQTHHILAGCLEGLLPVRMPYLCRGDGGSTFLGTCSVLTCAPGGPFARSGHGPRPSTVCVPTFNA